MQIGGTKPRLAWLPLLALAFTGPMWSQQLPAAPAAVDAPLKSVAVTGSKRFAPELLAKAGGLEIGKPVTKESLQAAADELGRLGLFSNVQYRFKSRPDGVELEFELTEAPLLPVHFDNFPWFTDDELTAALREAVVLFDGTAPSVGILLDDMAQALERTLAANNITAKVEHQVIARPLGDGDMVMFTVAGAALKIAGFEFQDAIAAESRQIAIAKQDMVGKPYSRYAIELFEMEQVRPVYLERGHLRAEFDKPRARFTGDPSKPLGDVTVAIRIKPGPVFSWGGVTWSGNQAIPAAELDNLVAMSVGGPANGMRIIGAWQRVESGYARRGYLDVKVEPQPTYDEAGARVSYRVAITEGTQYQMGELVITGLSPVAERKIRDAWAIGKGATFNRSYFEEFLDTGIKTAFGDYVVHYTEIGRWLRTSPETRVVDVLFDFR